MPDDYYENQKKLEHINKNENGFLNPKTVKAFAFFIILACVIIGIIVSIMAIWNFAEKDTLYRTLATLGVISSGCIIFSFINDYYG